MNPIKLRQMESRCAELEEEEIPRLESALAIAEQALTAFVSAEQTQMHLRQAEQLRCEHAAALAEWESLIVQLEEQAALS